MLVSNQIIKFKLLFKCILSIKLGAHMCAFVSSSSLKKTKKYFSDFLKQLEGCILKKKAIKETPLKI